MEGKEKIRVVWLAQFSNPEVRAHLKFKVPFIERLVRKLKHREFPPPADYCQWVTNAIHEFEKFDDVELHIIAPVSKLAFREVQFVINGINYYFYRDQAGTDIEFIKRSINHNHQCNYRKDRKYVKEIIQRINPDIVHLFGAENINNAYCLLDVPKSIPTIVQLQTLLSAPDFKQDSGMTKEEYHKRVECERAVIKCANYIGVTSIHFLPIIKAKIKKDVVSLAMPLALAEHFNISQEKKEYDFVYFARDISKAADWAIEAFIRASVKHPGITIHIIGGYAKDYKNELINRLKENRLQNNVVFEGELPTHDNVISQVRKARVALLPLKVDLVSGTIREAISNGIPVVTTITPSTPALNEKRKSVLLSEKEDFEGMAENMIKVLEDVDLASSLAKNAAVTIQERADNSSRMETSVKVYKACIANYKMDAPIPDSLLMK